MRFSKKKKEDAVLASSFLVLIRLGFFQFFRCNRTDIHPSPEVGDIGHYERDDERYDGHASQSELA